jgi:hypothetical protein
VLAVLLLNATGVRIFATDLSGGGVGFSAGYTHVRGYYENDFKPAASFSIDILPIIRNWFCLDLSVSYRAFKLQNSTDSLLKDYSAGAGGRLFYKMGPVAPYAGFLAGGDYLRLETQKTDVVKNTYKPSVYGRAGFLLFLPGGVTADLRGERSYREMSGRTFQSTTFGGAVIFRFGESSADIDTTEKNIAAGNFSEGVRAYNLKHLSVAERYFLKVPPSDKLYTESKRYLNEIRDINTTYEKARNLISQNKLLESIPLLEQISIRSKEAEDDLVKVRKTLIEQVDDLSKIGVAAYEAKDYRKCIQVMRMINAIDPDNKTVKIYLPRALQRERALQQDE